MLAHTDGKNSDTSVKLVPIPAKSFNHIKCISLIFRLIHFMGGGPGPGEIYIYLDVPPNNYRGASALHNNQLRR